MYILKAIQSQIVDNCVNKDYIKQMEESIIYITKNEAEKCVKVCVDIVIGNKNEVTGDCQDNKKLIGILMERGKLFDRLCDICSIDCNDNVLKKWKWQMDQENNIANAHKKFVYQLNKQMDLQKCINTINENAYNRYNYMLPVVFPYINWIDVSANHLVSWNTIVYSQIKPDFMKSVVCHATKSIPSMKWKNMEYICKKAKHYNKIRLWWSNRKLPGQHKTPKF